MDGLLSTVSFLVLLFNRIAVDRQKRNFNQMETDFMDDNIQYLYETKARESMWLLSSWLG